MKAKKLLQPGNTDWYMSPWLDSPTASNNDLLELILILSTVYCNLCVYAC